MAIMYPKNMEYKQVNSFGEKAVFESLKESLSDEWTVIYSLRWINKANKRSRKAEGEGDFLILNKDYGILVLEIKGGDISCIDRKWTSTDKNGKVHIIQDPEKQAADTMYEIIETLKTKGIRDCFVCRGVWFPDTNTKDEDLALNIPKEIVLDIHDLDNPEKGLLRIFKYWKSKSRFNPRSLDDRSFNQITNILMPRIRLVRTLKSISRDVNDMYVRLNQEQFIVLEALEENKRVTIKGHAGSGKTILAIEKARREEKKGNKALYLCYNNRLANNIKEDYENAFDIFTIHGFALNYMKKHYPARVIGFEEDLDFDYLMEEFLEVIEDNKEKGLEIYNTVILDEGQDFEEEWIRTLDYLIDDGSIYIFYDPLQELYDVASKKDYNYLDMGAIFTLKRNMRNTDEICKSSINILDKPVEDILLKGIKGKKPEILTCSKEDERDNLLVNKIKELINVEYMEKEDITVLTLNSANKNKYIKLIDNEYLPEIETVKRFKGLENDVIIIPDVSPSYLDEDSRRRLLYVGMSRARVHVILIINIDDNYTNYLINKWNCSNESEFINKMTEYIWRE